MAPKAPPLEDEPTLKDIMKELMLIKARQDNQEKYQVLKPKSEKKNWRESTPIRPSTQELERMWDSQRLNQTQPSQEN